MVFEENGGQFTIPNFKMGYHYQKEPTCLDGSCSFQMDGYKYGPEKMTKRSSSSHCKEPVEGFNEYSSLFSSRTYSRISNSILSYIVGGFVGSKSQMNNNKHNLSFDLSAVVFNLLNPCKYDREKNSSRKYNENNFYGTASKINPESYEKYIVGRSSQKCEKVNDCGLDIMELKCLVLPLEELVEPNNYVLDFKKKCNDNSKMTTKSYLNGDSEGTFSDLYSCDDYESKGVNSNIEGDEIISCDTTDHDCKYDVIENLKSMSENVDKIESMDKNNLETISQESRNSLVKEKPTISCLAGSPSIIISSPCDNSEKAEDMAMNSAHHVFPVASKPLDISRNSLSHLAIQRFRHQSECSVESTDSESFIVFEYGDDDDDGNKKEETMGMKIENDDSDNEEEEDGSGDDDSDDEEGSSSDDYDICSADKEITEANDKWLRVYKDAVPQENESTKKVRFNENVKINKIIAWDYAYRAARLGPWEQMARDRDRFRERILRLSSIISPVLRKEHRDKIYKEFYS